MVSRYSTLDREQLANLLPELLLIGQLIDRAAMPWCIAAFGREDMAAVAIDEWMAASPIYTRRMQRALGYEGTDVITIFKGLQLDIGAPPQFMDFRYTVHDPWHGRFHLDHCGALMDVEPMGEEFVVAMCHTIEDPTFDATAVATNPKAQVRPVHRPPRDSGHRQPHCAWNVIIDDSHQPVDESDGCRLLRTSRAAALDLDAIDPTGDGATDYSGPLVSDLLFADFASSALVRMADEVCLQMHLLALGFARSVSGRTDAEHARELRGKQLLGIAGVAAERLHRMLELPHSIAGALRTLELHPLLNPAGYVVARAADDTLTVAASPAHEDGAWISLCGPENIAPLQAIVRAVDPHLDVAVAGSATDWEVTVFRRTEAPREFDEVAVTKMSGGSAFTFQPRKSIPITPVGSRRS